MSGETAERTLVARYLLDTSNRRDVCAWLKCNGADPNDIPVDAVVRIETAGEDWFLTYEVFVRNEKGLRTLKPDSFDLATAWKTLPLAIDPPQHWLSPV